MAHAMSNETRMKSQLENRVEKSMLFCIINYLSWWWYTCNTHKFFLTGLKNNRIMKFSQCKLRVSYWKNGKRSVDFNLVCNHKPVVLWSCGKEWRIGQACEHKQTELEQTQRSKSQRTFLEFWPLYLEQTRRGTGSDYVDITTYVFLWYKTINPFWTHT